MAFKLKIKEEDKVRDCSDFIPYFFHSEFCKLTFKCENAGKDYELGHFYMSCAYREDRCTGMEKK